MPPIVIALRVSGADPETYWDLSKDDVNGNQTDNAGSPAGGANFTVRFIMTDLTTGEMVGHNASTNKYTGIGTVDEQTYSVGGVTKKKTILRYNWTPPSEQVSTYAGDTAKAGVYKCEFEVVYTNAALAVSGVQQKKRTFPATPGDILVVNILPDIND